MVNNVPQSYNIARLCTEDPISVSRQFSYKFHDFFNIVIMKWAVLGTVDHYYWKEYQSSSDDDDLDLPPVPLPKRPPRKKSRKEDCYEDVILEKLQSIENTIEKLKEDKNAPSSTAASGSSQQQVTEMLSNSLKCEGAL